MLSSIQIFLEKNRRWLFGFLLVVIIVPFVFTIGNMPGFFWRKKSSLPQWCGYDLSNRKQLEEVMLKGAMSMALREGSESNQWMENAQMYSLYRLWLLSLVRAIRLPEPTEGQLQDFIKTRKLFWDDKQQFQPSLYNQKLKSWKFPFPMRSLLVEDYQSETLQSVMQGVGCVLPQEVETAFRTLKSTYDLEYLVVKNEEKVGPLRLEELHKFFEEHKEDYRVPKKAEVTLLLFAAKQYMPLLAQPAEEELQAYWKNHSADFEQKGEKQEFSNVRERVKSAWQSKKLLQLAEEAASKWVVHVYDHSLVRNSEAWKQELETNHIRSIRSLSYASNQIPEEKGLPKEFLLKAFELSDDHFLSDPYPLPEGVGVLVLNQFLPPYLPKYDDVQDRVKEDAQRAYRHKAFHARVEKLALVLQKKGKIEKGLEVKPLPPLCLEKMSFEPLLNVLHVRDFFKFMKDIRSFQPNHWSKSYKGEGDSVVFFYCKDKKCPENITDNDAFRRYKEEFYARSGQTQLTMLANEALSAALPAHE